MTEFVKFIEDNDHEGETWYFWLQLDGNEDTLDRLADLLSCADVIEQYRFNFQAVLEDRDVDVLVKHGGSGYMDYHTKVPGRLVIPEDLIQTTEWGPNADQLYKGGIADLFI